MLLTEGHSKNLLRFDQDIHDWWLHERPYHRCLDSLMILSTYSVMQIFSICFFVLLLKIKWETHLSDKDFVLIWCMIVMNDIAFLKVDRDWITSEWLSRAGSMQIVRSAPEGRILTLISSNVWSNRIILVRVLFEACAQFWLIIWCCQEPS